MATHLLWPEVSPSLALCACLAQVCAGSAGFCAAQCGVDTCADCIVPSWVSGFPLQIKRAVNLCLNFEMQAVFCSSGWAAQPIQQLWNMEEPGLKILYYEVINTGLLLTKTSRKSREFSVSEPQNIAAEKAYDNSPSSPSTETMMVLTILILEACLLSVKCAKSLALFFLISSAEFWILQLPYFSLCSCWVLEMWLLPHLFSK